MAQEGRARDPGSDPHLVLPLLALSPEQLVSDSRHPEAPTPPSSWSLCRHLSLTWPEPLGQQPRLPGSPAQTPLGLGSTPSTRGTPSAEADRVASSLRSTNNANGITTAATEGLLYASRWARRVPCV